MMNRSTDKRTQAGGLPRFLDPVAAERRDGVEPEGEPVEANADADYEDADYEEADYEGDDVDDGAEYDDAAAGDDEVGDDLDRDLDEDGDDAAP